MTSPVPFQPPKNPWGRTAKELLGLGGRFGDVTTPPVVVVPFFTLSGFGVQLPAQPAAATYYGWLNRPWYDARWATHVRLVCDVFTPGATGAYFLLQRCTDLTDPDDDANWGTVGQMRDSIVYLDGSSSIGPRKGKWVKLSTAGRDENVYRVVAVGGDGVETPEHGLVWAEFTYRREPIPDRWYWRVGTPGDAFTWDNPNTYYGDFWGETATPDVWLTPTPAAVTAAANILSKTKNTSGPGTTDSSTSTDAHIDVSGIVSRFIGAPLRRQTVPPFTYRMGYAAQAPSGGVAGYAHFQLGIFRPSAPSAPIILLEDLAATPSNWFRFVTKQRIYYLDVEDEFDVEDGDRFFLDIIGNVDVASGISTTNGLGVNIGYNGAGLEDFTDGADLGGNDPASWVELPTLAYLTKDAT